jgi:undecaprenol kinase/diacylglycerol kinase (ATP)
MEKELNTRKAFSLRARAKSFVHAGNGLHLFFSHTHNAWLEILALIAAAMLGWYFEITTTEWLFLILSAGLVLVMEAVNTAIEIDIDLTSPEFHPYARATKDVAAGAVLIAACTALAVGLVIFLPHVPALW